MPKSWIEKRDSSKSTIVKILDKDFAGIKAGSKMLISSPQEIDNFIRKIPKGKSLEPDDMRKSLAEAHKADATCPVSTGIFLRIVAEAALEDYSNGIPASQITQFWKIINKNSVMAKKLSVDYNYIEIIKKLADN